MKDTFCMAVGALGAAIASLYGGQYGLSFNSHPGTGTEVTVRLPSNRALS